mgnify:FL=1
MTARFFLACAALLFSCTAPEDALRALRASGYRDVQLSTDYPWFACGKDDDYATAFTATNPVGERVTGVVCCGWLKNCTIRF